MKKTYDCNGREIKLGDRVRIIAAECNKFMHEAYADDWIPAMHWDADMFGTATVDDFFQVQDDNGALLWDLSWGGNESALEVVSMR